MELTLTYIAIVILLIVLCFVLLQLRQYKKQLFDVSHTHSACRNELNDKKVELERYILQSAATKRSYEKKLGRINRIEVELTNKLAEARSKSMKITDSILYAKNIQNAILPRSAFINDIIPENFILYRPKDIVSGDYYWLTKRGTKIIVAAADCTGHGVPGALMSMLGIAFLNEIIARESSRSMNFSLKAGEVLNLLSEKVRNSLQQTGQEGESKDGMDIALCIIDTKKGILEYAGAFSPIYVLKTNDGTQNTLLEQLAQDSDKKVRSEESDNLKLYHIAPDKMPIGIHFEKKSFTTFEIPINNNDLIYMFSDGFADQFGGEKGRKFSSRRFKELLAQNFDKPMAEQKEILDKTIDQWRGTHEQVDDIVVLGIRMQFDSPRKTENIDWSDKCFLIAEDDDVHYRYLKEILSATRVNLVWGRNGSEALAAYDSTPHIDLAIVDIHMPVMNGYELIEELKKRKKDLPIIVQAAYKMSDEKEKSFSAGCHDYLPKPINPAEFMNSIRKFVKTNDTSTQQ